MEKPRPHPRIAVVIVNWWSEGALGECLSAIERQGFGLADTVIVDNGGDESKRQRLQSRFRWARWVEAGGNLGFAGGANLGAECAEGAEWLLFLNPDTELQAGALAELAGAITAFPETRYFGATLLGTRDGQRVDGLGDAYLLGGFAWRRGHGAPSATALAELPPYYPVFAACGAAMLVEAELFASLGGFDEDFFCYLEDVDFGYRALCAGAECLQVRDARVFHVGSLTTVDQPQTRIYYGQRNLLWLYAKNTPGLWVWWLLVPHLLLNLGYGLLHIGRGHVGAVLRAKRDSLKGLARIWRKRRAPEGEELRACQARVKQRSAGWGELLARVLERLARADRR